MSGTRLEKEFNKIFLLKLIVPLTIIMLFFSTTTALLKLKEKKTNLNKNNSKLLVSIKSLFLNSIDEFEEFKKDNLNKSFFSSDFAQNFYPEKNLKILEKGNNYIFFIKDKNIFILYGKNQAGTIYKKKIKAKRINKIIKDFNQKVFITSFIGGNINSSGNNKILIKPHILTDLISKNKVIKFIKVKKKYSLLILYYDPLKEFKIITYSLLPAKEISGFILYIFIIFYIFPIFALFIIVFIFHKIFKHQFVDFLNKLHHTFDKNNKNIKTFQFNSDISELNEISLGLSNLLTKYFNYKNELNNTIQNFIARFPGDTKGVWELRLREKKLYYSNKWEDILGYNRGELENRFEEWEKRIHPDDRTEFFKRLDDHFNHKTNKFEFEHRVKAKDNKYRWIRSSGSILSMDENEKPSIIAGFYTDITNEKKLFMLKENLFKYSLDMISIINFQGNFSELNPAWTKITGWSIYELKSKNFCDFIHFDDRKEAVNILKKLQNKENISDFQTRFICKNSNFKWITFNAYPDTEEKIIFSVSKDITEKKGFEDGLKLSEKINLALLNAPSEIALLIESDGTIIGANQIACDVFQTDLEEIKGKNLYYFLYKKLRPLAHNLVEKAIKEQKPQILEDEQKGTIYQYNLYPVISTSGLVEKIAIYAKDITIRKKAEKELKQREEHFRSLFSGIPIPACTWQKKDDHFILKNFNKAANDFTRGGIQNIVNQKASKIYNDNPELSAFLDLCFKTGKNIQKEIFYCSRLTKKESYFNSSFVFIPPDHVLVLAEDITMRKKYEKEIKRLSLAVEHSPAPVLITSIDGDIEYVNIKFEETYEIDKNEAIGKNPRIIQSGKTENHIYKDLWQTILSGNSWYGEMCNRSLRGKEYWMHVSISPVTDSIGNILYFVGIHEDITKRKNAEKKLHLLATTDALTGLPNRRSFTEKGHIEVSRTYRYCHSFSILMIDVDHFKAVNDTFGHDLGDKVLMLLTKTLQKHLRDVDIPGRIGGEEFAVILPETDANGAFQAAEKIRKEIEKTPYKTKDKTIKFTVSIGIASIDMKEFNADELSLKKQRQKDFQQTVFESIIKKADIALYESKRSGRNQTSISVF